MSASFAVAPSPPPPLGPPNKRDELKSNPHPYAIKTTHTALLSRSNSSGHNIPSHYFYTPPRSAASRSLTKSRSEYRGHRYTTSLTGDLPSPLPSPTPPPAHPLRSHSEEEFASHRRQRADTLPTHFPEGATPAEPDGDLPLNPKTWTPSQLSVYLTTALRVRSGGRLPERVALDIAAWVRRGSVGGRTFLRWQDDDLKALGVNTLWRVALLTAARNLRQNVLRGRIWGNPTSDPELDQEEQQDQNQVQEASAPFDSTLYASSSSSLDLTLARGDDAEAPGLTQRVRVGAAGRVRGMVDRWERESAGSHSASSRSSSRSRSSSHSESGSEPGDDDARLSLDLTGSPVPVPGKEDAAEEPSVEELLALEIMPDSERGSCGARAWEDLDIGVTMRRVEPACDTVVPRRDGSGNGGSVRATRFGTRASRRTRGEAPTRRVAADIFAKSAPPADGEDSRDDQAVEDSVEAASAPKRVGAEPLADDTAADAEAKELELAARERALEDDLCGTRALLEEFRLRLAEVEARVDAMEEEWRAAGAVRGWAASANSDDKSIDAHPIPIQELLVTPVPTLPAEEDKKKTTMSVARGGVSDPASVSDLPSYMLLVGLGVCAVVLRVVLKRVAGRSLKP